MSKLFNSQILKIAASLLVCLVLAGCNGGKNQTNIENVSNMMDQHALKPQGYSTLQGKPAVRLPPEGTIARNIEYYKYKNDVIGAEKNLVNPYAEDFSEEILSMGKKYYHIYCSTCHGDKGVGMGVAGGRLGIIKPPNLLTDKAKAYSDARIYHIITDGQGLMRPYNTQIYKEKHRWAIVQYIRGLQNQKVSGGKKEEETKEEEDKNKNVEEEGQ